MNRVLPHTILLTITLSLLWIFWLFPSAIGLPTKARDPMFVPVVAASILVPLMIVVSWKAEDLRKNLEKREQK